MTWAVLAGIGLGYFTILTLVSVWQERPNAPWRKP